MTHNNIRPVNMLSSSNIDYQDILQIRSSGLKDNQTKVAPSQYQEWVADHKTKLGSKIEQDSASQFDQSINKKSRHQSKNNPVEKLIELGKTARKFTEKLDKLVYSETILDKKAENELFEKLGRKAHPNAMPSVT